MAIKAVLFDLDGTLLPMDQDEFVNAYFGLLSKRLSQYGYEPKQLVGAIWAGTKDMMCNTGEKTNEEVFWNKLAETYGEKILEDQPLFDDFYRDEFLLVKNVCGYNPNAAECVHRIKDTGLKVALATQPIFPSVATENRISWAGLDVSEFELYTTFENSSYSKPNLDYYREVARRLNVSYDACLMVGNDVDDDMIAETLGMQVFLLTDCLINNNNKDISHYPQGSFGDLLAYLNIQ